MRRKVRKKKRKRESTLLNNTFLQSMIFVRSSIYARILIVIFLGSSILPLSAFAADAAVTARQEQLQKELQKIEAEIRQQQVYLEEKKQERVSLERDIQILDGQIKKSKLNIQARNIAIQQLGGDIVNKQETIEVLGHKLSQQKESLGELIRRTNEIDSFSLVEVALAKENLSEFFRDLDSFDSLTVSLQGSFRNLESTKSETEKEKLSLEYKQENEVELKNLQELEKQKVEAQEKQKQQVLTVTKGQESEYKQIIAQKEQSAAQIRTELFRLRGTSAIQFGDALAYANVASKQTGVRPAFILGTLQQETRLGEFLGNGNWKTDMHPTRDQPVFEQIMKELGLNPDSVPVSAKPSYGWGGAMGPAQFIPSTWILYKDRIGQLTGNNPPNPYNPEDAFMAAALLMMDNGAGAGTRESERLAALRYFAGWGNAGNPAYAFYGDGVMELADQFQATIDQLTKLES